MQVLRDLIAASHGVEQLVSAVLGVRGHKSDDEVALDIVELLQELSEVAAAVGIFAVGIDILTEQGYLFIAALDKRASLGDYRLGRSAALPAPDIGHYAVAAKIVAAVHDGYPRLKAAVTVNGQLLGYDAVALGQLIYPLAGAQVVIKQLGQTVDDMSAENYIDKGVAVSYLLCDVLLLHHAAAEQDTHISVGILHALERPDIAEDSVLGVLTDGAGII